MNKFKNFSFWFVLTPYAWLIIFFLIPLSIILKISLSISEWGMPPYKDIYEFTSEGIKFFITLDNYKFVLSDAFYLDSFLNSLSLAFFSTFVCLILGFPLAFYIASQKNIFKRNILLILIIIPFWTSFLLRVYAWKVILQNSGVVNSLLLYLGIIEEPISMLYNHYTVILGVVYTYLPFMVLPLYGFLVRFRMDLIDASFDLGAKNIKTFFKVILPLSIPGIIAGSLLVFIPVVGEFVIPELLGGSDRLYYGKIIWDEFFVNRDWPIASALAMLGISSLVIPIIFFQLVVNKSQNNNE